ncbi:MAG: hypothetical protein C3F15_08450 [Holophagae bacterium]|nr:MAG: hypothetical protein C3F15_08450 [Holophagae bacterium]
MRRQLNLLRVVSFVVIGVCLLAVPALAQRGEGKAMIDPSVLAELDAEGEATFWVLFREQADLSPAHAIRDWNERGTYVYERLIATAESSQARVRALLVAWGAEMKPFWIMNVIEVKTHDGALLVVLAAQPEVAEIVAPPEVEQIEMVPGIEWHHSESIEWNIEHIRAPLVWSTHGVRGEEVVIGSIDGGVQYDHPALAEHYRGNLGGGAFDHNYNWYDPDFVCGSPSIEPCDPDGHGTATTGVAVGDDGGANQIGVAPGARFMMAATNFGVSSVLAAMQWMLAPTDLNGESPRPDLRPHVVNNSWGFGGGTTIFQAAVQAWVAAGIFPVFAIGNEGPNCSTGRSPGVYLEAYAVGAHDIGDNIWVSSSRGPSLFGPVKPNMTAPGVDIRTSWFGSAYITGSATSVSTPHVTGVVALMLSLNPELIGKAATIRRHLDHSAIDVSDLSCGGDPWNNNVWGEGRLDAFDAVSLLLIDGFESGDTSAWSATVP